MFTHERPGMKLSLSNVKRILTLDNVAFNWKKIYRISTLLKIIVNNFNSILVQFTCILLIILAHWHVHSSNCATSIWNTMRRGHGIHTPWGCGLVCWSHFTIIYMTLHITKGEKLISGARKICLVYLLQYWFWAIICDPCLS